MNHHEKRQLETELTVMGLPGLDDPALVQCMADVVNGYPIPAEREDFFIELLNECEGARRREMYEAMRPRLSIEVPSLDVCEARIAARAERMIRTKLMPGMRDELEPTERVVVMECGGCGKTEPFVSETTTGCVMEARKAGWGRGRERAGHDGGREYCASCRLMTMPVKVCSSIRMTTRNG